MLIAWKMESARTTRDIDLLGFTTNDLASVKRIVSLICNTRVSEDDGLHFDGSTIKTVRIKEDTPYAGVRVTFQGFLGESRIPMQIDIGFNDIVTPKPQLLEYPTILDHPIPKLKGYTPESIMAEKLEAMVKLGSINSRMKDFFDVWLLSRQ